MKKLLLFLATKKGYEVLRFLCSQYRENVGAVVSFDEIGVQKSWYEDIKKQSMECGIPFYTWRDIKNEVPEIIKSNGITGSVCISWRYLITTEINDFLEDNLIVFHDSLLPKYRGFAPVVTAMLCGEKKIGATAIFADDGVDTGEIICQKNFLISEDDYIADVIERMTDVYVEMMEYIIKNMLNNSLTSVQQIDEEATYSIWRDEEDYRIDWGMDAESISRFIHAVGYPYKGALTTDGDINIRIHRCSVVEKNIKFMITDPGKIWSIKDNQAYVVCGRGMLCIEEAYDEKGEKHVFKKLRVRLGRVLK